VEILFDTLLKLIERVNERNGAEDHTADRSNSPTGSPCEALERVKPECGDTLRSRIPPGGWQRLE
jgi:hypothetical protein